MSSNSLQLANHLLRQGEWEQALRAYQGLWKTLPHFRKLIEGNIAYVLRNAPSTSLDQVLHNSAIQLIKESDHSISLDGALEIRSTAGHKQEKNGHEAAPSPSRGSFGLSVAETGSLHRALKLALGIEKIYVVNLTRRPDRYIRVLREMTRHGLVFQRIDGVDAKLSEKAHHAREAFRRRAVGDRLPSSRHVSDDVMRRYKAQLPLGVFGYTLSQGQVIRDAMQQGHKRILVLDDDVFFCSDAVERLNSLSHRLPRDLKIMLLGASEYADRESEAFKSAHLNGHDDLYRPLPGETCGSFAMVYDHTVFAELLEAIEEADGTFDNVTLGHIYHHHPNQCLVIDPAICIPDVGDSDIRPDEREQELQSQKMRWEFARYNDYTHDFLITVLVNSRSSLRHVQTLKHELPSNIFLNIYYHSEDGLRPIISGHQFNPRDSEFFAIGATNGLQLHTVAEELRVPWSDIVISWPAHSVLTEESVTSIVTQAMALQNRTGASNGNVNGFIYCFDAGVRPVEGRHSIIIPSFRTVEEAWASVQSALLQDVQDFEVIVVSDNPSNVDFSTKLRIKVNEWSEQIGREDLIVRLIVIEHKKNRNASAARNTGLFASTGEFISFLDDDDLFDQRRLSAIEPSLARAFSDVGGCYCGYSGNWNGERNMDRFPEGNLGDRVLTLRYAEHYMCTNTVSFFRTSLLRLGGFNESYRRHQDLELMTRFFGQFKITAVKEFLVRNRPNPAPETFTANLSKLCHLKHQFLSDMRPEVISRGIEFADTVIDAHTKDIAKRYKDMPAETVATIRTFLSSALHLD